MVEAVSYSISRHFLSIFPPVQNDKKVGVYLEVDKEKGTKSTFDISSKMDSSALFGLFSFAFYFPSIVCRLKTETRMFHRKVCLVRDIGSSKTRSLTARSFLTNVGVFQEVWQSRLPIRPVAFCTNIPTWMALKE